jgi:hypothetical protein
MPSPTEPLGTRHLEARVIERRLMGAAQRLRLNALAAVVALFTTVVWLTPWLPGGMRAHDYAAPITIALGLVALTGATGSTLAFALAPILAREPKSELLAVLKGEDPQVRRRQRFLARLTFQCNAALERRADWFGLLVVRSAGIRGGARGHDAAVARACAVIRSKVRTFDVIGDSEDGEVWVLLAGAGLEGCARVRERLFPAFANAGAADGEFSIGWSAFDIDGRDPNTLFRAARRRMSVGKDARNVA